MGAIGREARWPSPLCVLRGYWRIILQVTARSRLSVLTPKNPSEQEGGREGSEGTFFSFLETLSAVVSFFFFFKRILSHHLASPAPPQCTAHNGFCFVFTIFPPTNHLSDQFYLLPPPHFPLSPPPPSKTPFSEVRHFTNHICCFSNCDFFF